MTRRVRNKNVRGCQLCQNPEISTVTDDIIYNCRMTPNELVANLEARQIYVDIDTIRIHITHVFATDDEDEEDITLSLKVDANMSNLEIVKDGLTKILIIERNLLREGKADSKEFLALLKEKINLLNLKSKLEGDLPPETATFALPPWIQKVPKQEIIADAEVVSISEKTE